MNRVSTPIKSPSSRRLSDTPRRNSRPGTPVRSLNSSDDVSSLQSSGPFSPTVEDHGVSVMIRIRPLNNREKAATKQIEKAESTRRISTADTTTLEPPFEVNNGSTIVVGERTFVYDGVMGPETTQQAVFETCAIPNVNACISGYHATFMAYGQSGAGKTHTMAGGIHVDDFKKKDSNGIIPRSLEYLFQTLESQKRGIDGFSYSCTASFVEIYNERVMDLLANTNSSSATNGSSASLSNSMTPKYIQLNYNQNDEVVAVGLSQLPIASSIDALELFINGNSKRHTSSTGMNEHSSRSHSIFTIQVNTQTPQSDGSVRVTKAKLSFVDLAGSECRKNTQAKGQTQMEAANINKSLLALSKLIMDLVTSAAQGKAPQKALYRGSSLTKYLKDCFGGNNKLCLIANISPSQVHITETISTLAFAAQARKLPNKPRSTATTSSRANANELINELMKVLSRAGTNLEETVASVGMFRSLLDDHVRLRRIVLEQQLALLDNELEIRQLRQEVGGNEDVEAERERCLEMLANLPNAEMDQLNMSGNSQNSTESGANDLYEESEIDAFSSTGRRSTDSTSVPPDFSPSGRKRHSDAGQTAGGLQSQAKRRKSDHIDSEACSRESISDGDDLNISNTSSCPARALQFDDDVDDTVASNDDMKPTKSSRTPIRASGKVNTNVTSCDSKNSHSPSWHGWNDQEAENEEDMLLYP